MRRFKILTQLLTMLGLLVTSCSSPQANVQAPPTQPPKHSQTAAAPTVPATAAATGTPGITTTIEPPQNFPTRLAWFYKPPADGNYDLIAKNFKFYIMSKGNETERDRLLALGAPRPILQYIRFDAIHDPGSCTDDPRQNNAAFVAGDYCNIDRLHPDWFLVDAGGNRFTRGSEDARYVLMDPGSPGWRAFFLERLKYTQDADRNWGGAFLDNVEVTFSRRERAGSLPVNYPDEASYQAAVQGFLEFLYTGYFKPTGRLMYANLIARKDDADWTKYLTYLDGAMHEGWAIDWPDGYRPVETWEKHMNLAEQTQAMGKFIVLVSQGNQYDTALQEFAYASYLLINHGRAAFRYANSDIYNVAWLYDDYSIDLGEALGPRYKLGDAWYRNYARGIVQVNPLTHEAQIKLKDATNK